MKKALLYFFTLCVLFSTNDALAKKNLNKKIKDCDERIVYSKEKISKIDMTISNLAGKNLSKSELESKTQKLEAQKKSISAIIKRYEKRKEKYNSKKKK